MRNDEDRDRRMSIINQLKEFLRSDENFSVSESLGHMCRLYLMEIKNCYILLYRMPACRYQCQRLGFLSIQVALWQGLLYCAEQIHTVNGYQEGSQWWYQN